MGTGELKNRGYSIRKETTEFEKEENLRQRSKPLERDAGPKRGERDIKAPETLTKRRV